MPVKIEPTVCNNGIRIPRLFNAHAVKHINSIKAKLLCITASDPLGMPAIITIIHRIIPDNPAPITSRGAKM